LHALIVAHADLDLAMLHGHSVFEIKPRGFDKGKAIERFIAREPFRGRVPIFIGDDTTDETVFAILPELDGIGFSVGRQVQGIAGCFDTPADVRAWLEKLAPADESVAP
jgi:trehalose 6-phosphate phosphatase